jgi:acyl-CoA synthetase (AMP-forming)/AMP-acid ligase II
MSAGPLYDLLHRGAEHGPDRPALSWDDHTFTYEQLRGAAVALAETLEASGLAPGDRVAIVAPNVPALVIAMFASWRAGAVAVPVSARLRGHDLSVALELVEATVVVSIADHHGFSFSALLAALEANDRLGTVGLIVTVDALGRVTAARASNTTATSAPLHRDVGMLLLTSGTTGAPRAALVSHGRELAGADALTDVLELTAIDTTVLVVPASHAFGLTCLLAALRSNGHAVLVDSTISPEPMMTAIARWDASILHGSPTLFSALAKSAGATPPSLRAGLVAGSTCPPELIGKLDDDGFTLLVLYGMTEIGAACATRPADPVDVRQTSVGHPLPGYDFRIRNGEVQVRGPYVTTAYFGAGAVDASRDLFDDGWLRTGDLGELTGGMLRIVGRSKDLAKVSGFTVAPAETETVLLGHPDVLAAVVIVVPSPTLGETLRAYVIIRTDSELTGPRLVRYARERLAGYKVPYALEIVSELPLLASGKPDRAALRARAQAERERARGTG